jgi:hypothetical protein
MLVYPVGNAGAAVSSTYCVTNTKSFCCKLNDVKLIVVVFDPVTAPTNDIFAAGDVDGVTLGVLDGVAVRLGVTDGLLLGVFEGVLDGVGVNDTAPAVDVDGVRLGVFDGVLLGVFDGVLDGVVVILGVFDGDTLIDTVAVRLGVFDGVLLGVWDGVTDGVGETGTAPDLLNAIVKQTHWSLFVERLYVPGSSVPANGSNK